MTISSESITIKIFWIGSKKVADAFGTDADHRVAPVAGLAELAVISLRVEKTFEARARVRVTVTGVVEAPVVAAVAGDARTTGNFRISVKVVSTNGAA